MKTAKYSPAPWGAAESSRAAESPRATEQPRREPVKLAAVDGEGEPEALSRTAVAAESVMTAQERESAGLAAL
jgi:hypothetical protein